MRSVTWSERTTSQEMGESRLCKYLLIVDFYGLASGWLWVVLSSCKNVNKCIGIFKLIDFAGLARLHRMGWETGKLGELAGVVGKSCPAEHLNLVRPVPLGPCNCVLLCCLCGAVSVRFVVNFDGILLSFVLDLIIPPGDLHFVPLHLYPSSRMALIRNN